MNAKGPAEPNARPWWSHRVGWLALAVVALAVLGLVAHRGALRANRPLRIAIGDDLLSLDPLSSDAATFQVLSNVFEGLVRLDGGMRLEPALAVRWVTPNERTWIFELRSGVRFHDGSPLTATEVKTAFDRVRSDAEAEGKGFIANVESVEATGTLSLRVTTRSPDALLLQRLSQFPVARGATTREVLAHPVGTGPYRFLRWERGRRVELAAYDEYWGGRPAARRVEIVPTPGQDRLRGLARGELDLAIVPAAALEIRPRPPLTLVRGPSLSRMFLWLCGTRQGEGRNPLADRRVRKAVALSLDRPALSEALTGDPKMAAVQLVPKAIFGYAPDIPEPRQDLAEARRLLSEAGWPYGFEAEMSHGAGPRAAPTVALLSEMLAKVGIRTSSRAASKDEVFAAFGGKRTEGFFVAPFTYDDGDAGSFLRDCIHSRDTAAAKGLMNPGFSDPAMDLLIDEALAVVDDAQRLGRYNELMRRANDEVPVVPLFDQTFVYGLAPGVVWKPRLDGSVLAAEITPAP